MILKTLMNITKADSLNFISPIGLGDTMLLNAYRKAIEEKYQLPLHFIIKSSHRPVMKLFANSNYSVYEFTEAELKGISKNNLVPQKGALYVAHPGYSDAAGLMTEWAAKAWRVDLLWLRFFGLDENTPPDNPAHYPAIPINSALPDPSQSVLLLPEAYSIPPLKASYWEKIAETVRNEGFLPVQNAIRPQYQIKDVRILPDDLDTVIAFALNCKKVCSLRSGLCDLIATKAKNLDIYYPNDFFYKVFFLEKQFYGQNLTNHVVGAAINKKFRKAVKKTVKKLPLVSYTLKKLHSVEDRLNKTLNEKVESRFAEFYNDLVQMGRSL